MNDDTELETYDAAISAMYKLQGHHTGHGVGRVASHNERLQQAVTVRESREKLATALQQQASMRETLEKIVERCEMFESINLVGRSMKAKEGGTLRNIRQDALAVLQENLNE